MPKTQPRSLSKAAAWSTPQHGSPVLALVVPPRGSPGLGGATARQPWPHRTGPQGAGLLHALKRRARAVRIAIKRGYRMDTVWCHPQRPRVFRTTHAQATSSLGRYMNHADMSAASFDSGAVACHYKPRPGPSREPLL